MAIVGKDTPFAILNDVRVDTYLKAIEGDERAPQAQDDTLVRRIVDCKLKELHVSVSF